MDFNGEILPCFQTGLEQRAQEHALEIQIQAAADPDASSRERYQEILSQADNVKRGLPAIDKGRNYAMSRLGGFPVSVHLTDEGLAEQDAGRPPIVRLSQPDSRVRGFVVGLDLQGSQMLLETFAGTPVSVNVLNNSGEPLVDCMRVDAEFHERVAARLRFANPARR